jgi:hypothetical protein
MEETGGSDHKGKDGVVGCARTRRSLKYRTWCLGVSFVGLVLVSWIREPITFETQRRSTPELIQGPGVLPNRGEKQVVKKYSRKIVR